MLDERKAEVLRVLVEEYISSQRFCMKTSSSFDVFSTFCASSRSHLNTSIEEEDSGGGYLMQYHGQWFVMGVVSVSPNQAEPTTTYFSRPEHFYDWIVENMGEQ